MASVGETTIAIEKLTADSYHTWEFNMRMSLLAKGLWEIVEGTVQLPEFATETQRNEFRRRDNKALSMIYLSISASLQSYVRAAKNSKEAWDSLAKHFENKTLPKKDMHRMQLCSERLGKEMIVEHFEEEKLPEDTSLISTAQGNGRKYKRRKYRHRKFKCHYCHEVGHFIRDCEKKRNVKAEKESAASCRRKEGKVSNTEFCPEFAFCIRSNGKKDEKWLLDSACSKHITGMKKDLVNFKEFDESDGKRFVELADKSVVRAEGYGELQVYLFENGKKVPILFKEVLYVPRIAKRLISIGQLTKKEGVEVLFKKENVLLRINGRELSFGKQIGNLYMMNGIIASCCFVSEVDKISEKQVHVKEESQGKRKTKTLEAPKESKDKIDTGENNKKVDPKDRRKTDRKENRGKIEDILTLLETIPRCKNSVGELNQENELMQELQGVNLVKSSIIPELVCNTNNESAADSVGKVWENALKQLKFCKCETVPESRYCPYRKHGLVSGQGIGRSSVSIFIVLDLILLLCCILYGPMMRSYVGFLSWSRRLGKKISRMEAWIHRQREFLQRTKKLKKLWNWLIRSFNDQLMIASGSVRNDERYQSLSDVISSCAQDIDVMTQDLALSCILLQLAS